MSMKALVTSAMVVEVEDFDHLEDLRRSSEQGAWNALVEAARAVAKEHNRELTDEDLNTAILFLGVQTYQLPSPVTLDD